MIYTTCLMAYATFSYRRSTAFRVVLAAFLTSLALFITLYYHYLQDPRFHQNAYGLLTAIVLFRCMYVMEVNIRPRWREQMDSVVVEKVGEGERRRRDTRDEGILKTMWVMIAVGLSIFLGGFGLWALDNVYCSRLRGWRRQVGMPWGFLLEGHGWW